MKAVRISFLSNDLEATFFIVDSENQNIFRYFEQTLPKKIFCCKKYIRLVIFYSKRKKKQLKLHRKENQDLINVLKYKEKRLIQQ